MRSYLDKWQQEYASTHEDVIQIISYAHAIQGTIYFATLLVIVAPYGKHVKTGMGPTLNASFAWCLQEIPTLVGSLLCLWRSELNANKIPNIIVWCLLILHYFNRSLIYPFQIRGGKPVPLFSVVIATIFCACNGYIQAGYILWFKDYSHNWQYNPSFYIGILLFLIGMSINFHSDYILRNLRKPGDTSYHIPKGGMFEYVSGANFLGEIIEWTGYAIAVWGLPAWSFAYFTACNIGPRAFHHHSWYKQKFEDYPKDRKALIPFIW